ncbi:MAG: response regulator [Rhodanobacter sp.]
MLSSTSIWQRGHVAKGTILVVEDDPVVRAVASGLLEDFRYSALEAVSGREALDLVESGQRLELVFTDVIMPGDLDGIDLARELKSRHRKLPVLLASGYTAQHMAEGERVEGCLCCASRTTRPSFRWQSGW